MYKYKTVLKSVKTKTTSPLKLTCGVKKIKIVSQIGIYGKIRTRHISIYMSRIPQYKIHNY